MSARPIKPRASVTMLVSAVFGAMVWALSPLLTGHQEPWDADGWFYVGALVVTGSLAGAMSPRPLWALYLGAFTGQLGYELIMLPVGPLLLLGAAFLLGYSAIFLAAAALAGSVRRRLARGPSKTWCSRLNACDRMVCERSMQSAFQSLVQQFDPMPDR